jgi:hypothetical protein
MPPKAAALWVNPVLHAAECRRFDARVVEGPREQDCSIFNAAIGGDGYGRFYIYRAGIGLCVRPNRYALARTLSEPLASDVLALHECDNPLCVRVSAPGAQFQHVVAGTQRDNMIRMARMRRGGGRRGLWRREGLDRRRARSVALREAVRDGWDPIRVYEALLGDTQPTLW